MMKNNVNHKEIVLCFNLKNEGLRKFFSIKQRRNGDLIMMPKYADSLRKPGEEPDNNIQINHQKFSIHCSPNSQEFNVCMNHLEFSDGTTLRVPHYTKTVKSNKGKLTALYFCQPPDLSSDKYKLTNKDQNNSFCLDEYDPATNTLYYGIFVCSNSTKSFLSFQTGAQNYRTFKFSNFTVLVVWTYQYMPSISSGSMIHCASIDDQKINQELGANIYSTTEGFTGKEAKMKTLELFNQLREELFITLLNNNSISRTYYSILVQLPFVKTPNNFMTKGK